MLMFLQNMNSRPYLLSLFLLSNIPVFQKMVKFEGSYSTEVLTFFPFSRLQNLPQNTMIRRMEQYLICD